MLSVRMIKFATREAVKMHAALSAVGHTPYALPHTTSQGVSVLPAIRAQTQSKVASLVSIASAWSSPPKHALCTKCIPFL